MRLPAIIFIFLSVSVFLASCEKKGRHPSDKKLLSIDSNAIEGWEVLPSKELKMRKYSVQKSDGTWQVIIPGGEAALADREYIRRGVNHLANLKAKEEIRIDSEGWDSMGVTDKGTHLKIKKDGKIALELIIGKMFFENNKATYYVRPAGEKTVYTLPLYLEGSVIAEPERVRQKDLLHFSIAYVTDIKFLNPGGVAHTLHRDSATGSWTINGKPAEGVRVAEYLEALHSLVINKFSDAPITGVVQSLMITAADGTVAQIRVSQKNSDTWVLSSPENPGNYAEIDQAAVTALFPGEVYFLKK